MKISWGVGISITIIVFMLISIGFIYFAFNQEVNLVRDNYYEAEVQFDGKMESIKRTESLSEKLKINLLPENIEIKFPIIFSHDKITGNISLYRPSNRDMDIAIDIQPDSLNNQIINTSNMIRGMWKIQVEWNVDTISYYNEKILMVQ